MGGRIKTAGIIRNRRLQCVGALAIGSGSLFCSACTRWVEVRFDNAPNIWASWPESRVTYPDGQRVELDKSRLAYPLLYGEVTSVRQSPTGRRRLRTDWDIRLPIDVRTMARIERRQFSLDDTLVRGTGILIGVGSLVAIGIGFGWIVANFAIPQA